MRLGPKQSIEMPKQQIEICLVNTYTCFIGTHRCRENYPWIINDLRWISTNQFYTEKPMGGFLSSDWLLRY